MQGYRDVRPTKPSVPVIDRITAKATGCCINETNLVNSSIDNTQISQTCIQNGEINTQRVESSGNQITKSGSGSTSIVDSSAKSSGDEQQQYMIIAIVIISIILSSSVLLLLLLS